MDNLLVTILAVVAIAILGVAILYEPAALPPNVAKYAPPHVEALQQAVLGRTFGLDSVIVDAREQPITDAPISVANGEHISIAGWAIDPRTMAPGLKLTVTVDRRQIGATILYAIARPDVASALNDPSAATSGFRATLAPFHLSPGRHRLTLAVIGMDQHVTILPNSLTLEVAPISSVTKRAVLDTP